MKLFLSKSEPKMKMSEEAGVIRKLQVSGTASPIIIALLAIINFILAENGLPAITAEDMEELDEILIPIIAGIGSLITWFLAYRARPHKDDIPVVDEETP